MYAHNLYIQFSFVFLWLLLFVECVHLQAISVSYNRQLFTITSLESPYATVSKASSCIVVRSLFHTSFCTVSSLSKNVNDAVETIIQHTYFPAELVGCCDFFIILAHGKRFFLLRSHISAMGHQYKKV